MNKEVFQKILRGDHHNWSKIWNDDYRVMFEMRKLGWVIPGAVDYSQGARYIRLANDVKLHIVKNWQIVFVRDDGELWVNPRSLEVWDRDIIWAYNNVYA